MIIRILGLSLKGAKAVCSIISLVVKSCNITGKYGQRKASFMTICQILLETSGTVGLTQEISSKKRLTKTNDGENLSHIPNSNIIIRETNLLIK